MAVVDDERQFTTARAKMGACLFFDIQHRLQCMVHGMEIGTRIVLRDVGRRRQYLYIVEVDGRTRRGSYATIATTIDQ